MHTGNQQQQDESSFAEEASKAKVGIVGEFIGFMREYAKWWLTPIVLVLLMVGLLVAAGSSSAMPFIYVMW